MCREEAPTAHAMLMMGSDQYCLKWNYHWTNLVGVFNSLLQSETFVDVTIACEGRRLKAHRLVLSACSPYFTRLLVENPDRHPVIILKGVKYDHLKALIHFIYNGEVAVEQSELPALISIAREFQIRGLADNRLQEAVSIEASSSSSILSNGKIDNVIPLPLSLVTSSADQPTDLTSNSYKERNRTGSSENPSKSSNSTDFSIYTHRTSPNIGESLSPTRKKRRILDDIEQNGIEFSDEPENLSTDTNGSAEPQTMAVASVALQDTENEPLPLIVESARDGGLKRQQSPPRMPDITASQMEKEDASHTNFHGNDGSRREDDDHLTSRDHVASAPIPPSGLSVTPLPHASPLIPTTPSTPPINRQQLAFIQRALSMGYPPLPYFPPGLDPQPPGQPPLHPASVPSINSQTKDLLQFLDLVKSLGNSESALASGMIPGFPLPGVVASNPAGQISPSKESDSEYTCHICARIMPSQQFLDEHIKIHEEEKPYKCDHCGQRYKYQSAFQRHQEQNHTAKLPGEKPYRCTVCGQCFKYHKSFLKHRSNHDVLDHIMKNESEDSKSSLHPSYIQCLLNSRLSQSNPMTATPSHPRGDIRGSPVTPIFKEEMVDIDDSITEHPSTPSATIPENGEIKEEEEEMDYGEESGPGKFMHCLKCKSTFRDIVSFDAHCRLLSPECSQEFMREVSVPGENSNLSNPHSGSSSPPASPHRSPGWPSCLNSRSPLAGAAASSPQLTSQASLLSPSCATTASSSMYSNLTSINFTPMSGIERGSKGVLHPIIVSAAASVCPASVCAPTLGSSGSCKIEDNAQPSSGVIIQEEERPFKCPYCAKGFKGRENLKLHIRTHTGEKPYNCGVCGKAFGGRSDMNRHLRIHTGEKPYPCKVCGKKFARADYLSKHITTHLGIPFAKPVHSLQQSLQNLETVQSFQSAQNAKSIHSLQQNLESQSFQNVQNAKPVHSLQHSLESLETIQSFQNLQQNIQKVNNVQSN